MIKVKVNNIINPPNMGVVFMSSLEELSKVIELADDLIMFVDDENNKWFFGEEMCYVVRE